MFFKEKAKEDVMSFTFSTVYFDNGDELRVAIPEPHTPYENSANTVYDVFPTIADADTVDENTPLVLKVIRDSARTEHKQNGWQPAIHPEIASKIIAIDTAAKTEANNNTVGGLVSRSGLMESIDSEGTVIAKRIILMAKAPGISLKDFRYVQEITREQIIRVIINLCDYYAKLHAAGVYHRDINLRNIKVDPITLQITVFDIDQSHYSIKAPEDTGTLDFKLTAKIDIYALAEILMSLTSKITIKKNDHGDIANIDAIKNYIHANFDLFSIKTMEEDTTTSDAMIDLLEKMHHADSHSRPDLIQIKQILIEQLRIITGNMKITEESLHKEQEKVQVEHMAQLQMLARILADPAYNPNAKNIVSKMPETIVPETIVPETIVPKTKLPKKEKSFLLQNPITFLARRISACNTNPLLPTDNSGRRLIKF
jgi:serine/threonine protein kinase